MTTHYQKIQALGNRMAENLTIMGVPSQFDEGGLTLADKILEISSGITTGILLYGDKKVAQSGDTVNLSMMVLENGEFQPNTNVILHETILDKTYSDYSHISKSIGDNWVIEGPFENIISSSDTSGTTITAWGNGNLTINVNGNQVYHDSEAGSISKISYINKILSYNNKTVDLTEYNASFNVLSNVKAGRIIVKTAYVLTTDTHGLATHAYTCSGSGLKEFYATSGTFVSETYGIFDYLAYDSGVRGTKNENWFSSGNPSIETDDNGTLIGGTVSYVYRLETLLSGNFEAKVEVIGVTGGVRVGLSSDNNSTRSVLYNPRHIKIRRENGVAKIYASPDGVNYAEMSYDMDTITSEDCKFIFYSYTSGGTYRDIKYKDLKIYSI